MKIAMKGFIKRMVWFLGDVGVLKSPREYDVYGGSVEVLYASL